MGTHDHSGHGGHGGHDEDSEHGSEEKNVIYKSLMAVAGIYLFYLMESVMGLVRERKRVSRELSNILATQYSFLHSQIWYSLINKKTTVFHNSFFILIFAEKIFNGQQSGKEQ